MNIETITIKHPSLNNRRITLLLIENQIDIPSTNFLIYEARYGGRYNSTSGRSTHTLKANQIAELYRHLDDIELKWDTASEFDIKRIRNAMLCWDMRENPDYDNYPYEAIANDTMNHKLNTWFKFYKHMIVLGTRHDMVLTTKRINKFKYKGLLDHLSRRSSKESEYIDKWTLKVKPSPKSIAYHALTRTEFSILRKHLRDIDIVYETIALFMVETGLRITAALEAVEDDFKGLFRYYASGKDLNDSVKRNYIPKGSDEFMQYDLPLRTIQEIHDTYLLREYGERLYLYEKRCDRLSHEIKNNLLWITKTGKELKSHDVWNAFNIASKKMKRTVDKITPHWLRHTFATWTIIDLSNSKGIDLRNTGTVPSPLLILALQEKLGHADAVTTMRYISTALKLMGIDVNNGAVKISLRDFRLSKVSQKLVREEAIIEFEDEFNEEYFNVIEYALDRGIVINDELI